MCLQIPGEVSQYYRSAGKIGGPCKTDTFQFVSIKETAEGQHTILGEFLPLYSKKEKNVLLPRAILVAITELSLAIWQGWGCLW